MNKYYIYIWIYLDIKAYGITTRKFILKNLKNVQENKSLICEFCKKIFNNRSAKSIHKKHVNQLIIIK